MDTQKIEEKGRFLVQMFFLGGCFKFGGMQERKCHTKGMGSLVDRREIGRLKKNHFRITGKVTELHLINTDLGLL